MNEALVDLTLKGRPMSVTNEQLQELAPDLSTRGCFSKAWIWEKDGFVLLKDGGIDIVKSELLASKICQCFDFNQCFLSYDNLEGAKCLPLRPRQVSQREAAIEAVKHIGLRQIRDIDMSWFGDWTEKAAMFQLRLNELR